MQTIINTKGKIIEETEIERLRRIRMQYYEELISKISQMNKRKIELIKSYELTVKELDKKINSLVRLEREQKWQKTQKRKNQKRHKLL